MVGLVAERCGWHKLFEQGTRPSYLLMYEKERESEYWRDASSLEQLAEYALWLEGQLKNEGR